MQSLLSSAVPHGTLPTGRYEQLIGSDSVRMRSASISEGVADLNHAASQMNCGLSFADGQCVGKDEGGAVQYLK
jgi:hypothetical protein